MEDKRKNDEIGSQNLENDATQPESANSLNEALEPIQGFNVKNPDEDDEHIDFGAVTRDFKNIRLYLQIAGICAPVSLVFGGILLGTVALIFGILAFRKIARYTKRHDELGARARYVRKFAVLALAISVACIIANAVFVVTNWSELSSMISSRMTGTGSSGSASGGGTSSTWG